jgi:HK97 gp10 family phage protein
MANESGTWSSIDKGSIGFKVELTGLDAIRRSSEEIQKAVDQEIKKALYVCAKQVEKEAKVSLQQGGKSGKIYTLRPATGGETPTNWFTINGRAVGFIKRSKPHTASAPGEAPATDTGRLVNSINSTPAIQDGNELVATITTAKGGVKYAGWLEFGTSKIAARPFMFPALEKSKAFIQERLAKALVDGLWRGTQSK